MSFTFITGKSVCNAFSFGEVSMLESCPNRHCSLFKLRKANPKLLLCSWSRMGFEVSSHGMFFPQESHNSPVANLRSPASSLIKIGKLALNSKWRINSKDSGLSAVSTTKPPHAFFTRAALRVKIASKKWVKNREPKASCTVMQEALYEKPGYYRLKRGRIQNLPRYSARQKKWVTSYAV